MPLEKIEKSIIACERCPELNSYCKKVALEKVRRYKDKEYWGKPVPGFGDSKAQLVIVGLAPGAHGANRTGRMFTGDSSGDWLFKALYETGFATSANSETADDGMLLNDCYIMSTIHCAPPQNKPTTTQITKCDVHRKAYLAHFNESKIILCLGGVSFKATCRSLELKNAKFAHNNWLEFEPNRFLVSSYHPSKYNTQTKRLKWEDWLAVFNHCRDLLSLDP